MSVLLFIQTFSYLSYKPNSLFMHAAESMIPKQWSSLHHNIQFIHPKRFKIQQTQVSQVDFLGISSKKQLLSPQASQDPFGEHQELDAYSFCIRDIYVIGSSLCNFPDVPVAVCFFKKVPCSLKAGLSRLNSIFRET